MPSDSAKQLDTAFIVAQEANESLNKSRKEMNKAINLVAQKIISNLSNWLESSPSITFLNGALTAIFEIDNNRVYCTIIQAGDEENTSNSVSARSNELPHKPEQPLLNAYALKAFATAMQCIRWY